MERAFILTISFPGCPWSLAVLFSLPALPPLRLPPREPRRFGAADIAPLFRRPFFRLAKTFRPAFTAEKRCTRTERGVVLPRERRILGLCLSVSVRKNDGVYLRQHDGYSPAG